MSGYFNPQIDQGGWSPGTIQVIEDRPLVHPPGFVIFSPPAPPAPPVSTGCRIRKVTFK